MLAICHRLGQHAVPITLYVVAGTVDRWTDVIATCQEGSLRDVETSERVRSIGADSIEHF